MAVKPGGSRQDTKFAGRYKLPGQRGSLSDHHRFLQLEQFALSSARAISVSFFIQLLHDCIRLCPIAQPDDPVIGQDPYPCSPLAIYHLELVQSPIHSPDDRPTSLTNSDTPGAHAFTPVPPVRSMSCAPPPALHPSGIAPEGDGTVDHVC
jgi:hypothetical protein